MPDISIVIVSYNTCDLLEDCLDSITQTAGNLDLEIIVVDNASSDGSLAMLSQKFPCVRCLANQTNVGFARANNQGAAVSRGPYLLLLNSDTRLLPGALQSMLELMQANPQVGLVGATLRNVDGTFQASYTPFPGLLQEFLVLSTLGRRLYGPYFPSHGPEDGRCAHLADYNYVEGACMLIRREAYMLVGGLDEGYFMYSEDVDLCYALREKGWQVWFQPAAQVIHLGGGSSQHRRPEREADLYCSQVRFFQKHYGRAVAYLLFAQIYSFTATKILIHGLLRRISHGRYGRPVVPLRRLAI